MDWADKKVMEIARQTIVPVVARKLFAVALREAAQKGVNAVIHGDDDLTMTPVQ
jgi:hypothetical protein